MHAYTLNFFLLFAAEIRTLGVGIHSFERNTVCKSIFITATVLSGEELFEQLYLAAKNSSTIPRLEYLQILRTNVFMNLINKSTRKTSSQTTIDHILTNDNKSSISHGVFHFSISDHYPIFCLISYNKFKVPKSNSVYSFRNIKSVDEEEFRNDLESALSPLHMNLFVPIYLRKNFDTHFDQFVQTIFSVIEKHAPLQAMSRKQNRIQQKPCRIKGLLYRLKKSKISINLTF